MHFAVRTFRWSVALLALVVALALRAQTPSTPTPAQGLAHESWPLPDPELPSRLEGDVRRLVSDFHPRDRAHPENLDRTAAYLKARLTEAGGRTSEQVFQSGGKTYRNILARFGPEVGDCVVVGAHYDAVSDRPGADDNASGVAGLLELARRFGKIPPAFPVELAAYSLEESGLLGSAEHAHSLATAGAPIRGMISLEMIGCFLDAPRSQKYPLSVLKLFYPSRGNFIVVAGKTGDGGLARRIKRIMAKTTPLPVRAFVGPRSLVPDIGRSDHASFWKEGYPAAMVTDTANLRNRAYHSVEDLPERLDFRRMAMVVLGVEQAVRILGAP
jgi:hypothetical protein